MLYFTAEIQTYKNRKGSLRNKYRYVDEKSTAEKNRKSFEVEVGGGESTKFKMKKTPYNY